MSIPIWVVDPTGNNNPFLKIIPPTIFVASEEAFYTGPPSPTVQIGRNCRFWWSEDANNWNLATVDATSAYPNATYTGLYFPTMDYGNGTWMAKLFFDNTSTGQSQLGLMIYSADGKSWTTVFTETPMIGGNRSSSFSFDYVGNRWDIVYNSGTAITPIISHVYVSNPNPAESGSPSDPRQADSLIGSGTAQPGNILADSSQSAVPPSQVAFNKLPSGITAFRFNNGTPNDTFEVTSTSITSAIINSGINWPAAAWVRTFACASADPAENGNGSPFDTVFYGAI